jgi:hypothetical protein
MKQKFSHQNFISRKITRIWLMLIYSSRKSVITTFGSIVSPKEIQVQKSIENYKRIMAMKRYLDPVILSMSDLRRYGSKNDGGYVLPKKAVAKSQFLISGGIEDNNDFEVSLAKLGIKGVQIDNSIDTPPLNHKNLRFKRATLGIKSEVNIDDLIISYPEEQNGILKLDIEGSEYAVLTDLKELHRLNIIVVEFHDLFRISSVKFWSEFEKILNRLSHKHVVVFMAANNCCGFTNIGGFPIPNVLEITWVKKSLVQGEKIQNYQRSKPFLISANYPKDAPLDISALFPIDRIK